MADITQRHIGVTGRRDGLSSAQQHAVFGALLAEIRQGGSHFHHGACTGLDAFVHYLLQTQPVWTVVHPPVDKKCSAEAHLLRHDRRFDLEAKPYGERNQDIVEGLLPDDSRTNVAALIAAPAFPEDAPESRRSGTWQTVRKAHDLGIPVTIVDSAGDTYPYVPKAARSRNAS